MAGLGFFDMARQDLGFGLRTFRRAPTFTLVVIATLYDILSDWRDATRRLFGRKPSHERETVRLASNPGSGSV